MINNNIFNENVGNYYDSIKNIMFKIQKYYDILSMDLKLYTKEKENFLLNDKIIGFIICESEEILKNKLICSGFEIETLIIKKYNNFVSKIINSDVKNDVSSYYISEQTVKYIQNLCKKISTINLYYNNEIKKTDSCKNINTFNYEIFFDDCINQYETIVNNDYIKSDKNHLVKILSESRDIFSNTIHNLCVLMLKSSSIYELDVIMKYIIKSMVLSYIFIIKIKVENE